MKNLFLIVLLVWMSVENVLASETPLLTKLTTNGTVSPKELRTQTVEIYEFGDVLITRRYGYKVKAQSAESVPMNELLAISSCLKSNSAPRPVLWPKCAGGESTSYALGKTLILVRACGETVQSPEPCVESAIKLLDQYGLD